MRVLKTIHEVVDIGHKNKDWWFRGHGKTCGNLTPKVFRSKEATSLEKSMIGEFVRVAPALATAPVPARDDYLAWLVLAQHHGLPTRLLDWTESILVALYFVVEEEVGSSGELWAFDPMALRPPPGSVCSPEDDFPAAIAEDAFPDRSSWTSTSVAQDTPRDLVQHPYPAFPSLRFPRMVAQSSVFTIHPDPARALRDILDLEQTGALVRFAVPSEYQAEMGDHLSALRITPRTLFPDLDHLAETITVEMLGRNAE